MNSKLKDKISGALIGYAVGDALGLGTEFMTADEVSANYPEGLKNYSDIVLDAHRSQWGRGNWSHDTVFVIQLVEDIMRDGGINTMTFAKGMADWYGRGHYDIPTQLRVVLSHPKYREDPYLASRETCRKMGPLGETSSVLGIAAIAGMAADDLATEPGNLCRTLQCGFMSLGCTQAVAHTANALLWEDRIPTPDELETLVEDFSSEIIPYVRYATTRDGIKGAEVDDEDTLWMVRKSMAVALWALWNFDTFEDALCAAVMLGGDADTNAAVTGALYGLKAGRSAIPQRWIEQLNRHEEIEELADRFADYLISRRG